MHSYGKDGCGSLIGGGNCTWWWGAMTCLILSRGYKGTEIIPKRKLVWVVSRCILKVDGMQECEAFSCSTSASGILGCPL